MNDPTQIDEITELPPLPGLPGLSPIHGEEESGDNNSLDTSQLDLEDEEFEGNLQFDEEHLYDDEIANMHRQLIVNAAPVEAKKCEAMMNDNLWTLLCCSASENVTANDDRVKTHDYYVKLGENFRTALVNLKKKDHLKTRLFTPLNCVTFEGSQGGKANWPGYFETFLEEKNQLHASAASLAKARSTFATISAWSDQKVQNLVLGQDVKDTALNAASFINKHLVKAWDNGHPLTSGHTREQLLRAIRRSCVPIEAGRRAKNNSRVGRKRFKAKHGREMSPDELLGYYNKSRDAAAKRMGGEDWFPSVWMTFVLCSAPADDQYRFKTLNGGKAAVRKSATGTVAAPVQRFQSNEGRGSSTSKQTGRKYRRRTQNAGADGTVTEVTTDTSERDPKKPRLALTHSHTVVFAPDPAAMAASQIANQRQLVELLHKLNKPHHLIAQQEERLMEFLIKEQNRVNLAQQRILAQQAHAQEVGDGETDSDSEEEEEEIDE